MDQKFDHSTPKLGARPVLSRALLYAALGLIAALTLTPALWLLAGAVKNSADFSAYTFFPPFRKLSLDNFHTLFDQGADPTKITFDRFMINSFFVASTTVLVQLFFASLGGFALAKYEFKGKRPAMILMLATMMIPGQVMLAPLYELIYHMRLMDSYLGLIVPGAVSVFGMFLFRQAMMRIPDDLLQAARIDGCSEFGLYWRVALPVVRPMVGAFCLIAFMGAWNSFLWPQIIIHSGQRFTLPIALSQFIGLQQEDLGALMAGTLLSILPPAILFFILQKEFIAGLTAGAVKG